MPIKPASSNVPSFSNSSSSSQRQADVTGSPSLPSGKLGSGAILEGRNKLAFHDAVRSRDARAIQRLREAGHRPIHLDERGNSAVDLLRFEPPDSATETSTLLQALQGSLNAGAPPGYVKPDLFHGSPWGLEILLSGKLIAGANDPKGGAQSLQGKVFFSGRTPLSPSSLHLRENLRSKPRSYAAGNSSSANAPEHRLRRYVHLGEIRRRLDTEPDGGLGGHTEVELPNMDALGREVKRLLLSSQRLPARIVVRTPAEVTQETTTCRGYEFHSTENETPAIFIEETDVPAVSTTVLEGDELKRIYRGAIATERESMEKLGKVPFIAALSGRIVPLVFGFESVSGLKTHSIRYGSRQEDNSYKDDDHPLSGTLDGEGRLKEIELRESHDLPTLLFACIARNVKLPNDLVVRVKSNDKNARASYFDSREVALLMDDVRERLRNLRPAGDSHATAWLQELSIDELRDTYQTFMKQC